MEENDKKTNEKIDFGGYVNKFFILPNAFYFFFSSLMYINDEKWFSRAALSIICFGIFAIVDRLKK